MAELEKESWGSYYQSKWAFLFEIVNPIKEVDFMLGTGPHKTRFCFLFWDLICWCKDETSYLSDYLITLPWKVSCDLDLEDWEKSSLSSTYLTL